MHLAGENLNSERHTIVVNGIHKQCHALSDLMIFVQSSYSCITRSFFAIPQLKYSKHMGPAGQEGRRQTCGYLFLPWQVTSHMIIKMHIGIFQFRGMLQSSQTSGTDLMNIFIWCIGRIACEGTIANLQKSYYVRRTCIGVQEYRSGTIGKLYCLSTNFTVKNQKIFFTVNKFVQIKIYLNKKSGCGLEPKNQY